MTYLDHAATAPVLPEVVEAMARQHAQVGNASSLHAHGRQARRAVEEARESIAAHLGARPSEVVFTSGGTEANNLFVKGMFWRQRAVDAARTRIITSSIEHHALIDPVDWLRGQGALVDELRVDANGRIDLEALDQALDAAAAQCALVSVMWANNEVGTVQPIAEVVERAKVHDLIVHSDAVQAVGHLDVDFGASGLNALSLSAHKFGGPTGVGALVLGRDLNPEPLVHGGGQERGVRSGTLDVASIVGMAVALDVVMANRDERSERIAAVRDELIRAVIEAVPDAVLNGAPTLDSKNRLPGNAHFSFPGCEGDALLLLLDAQGISCSTGSACSAGVAQPSHVLIAMGADDVTARSSLRFSLGHGSSSADVAAVAAAIGPAVQRARAAGQVGRSPKASS
jgi:cysteine desulfurase